MPAKNPPAADARGDAAPRSRTPLGVSLVGKKWSTWLLGILLVLGIVLVYSNSLRSPFTYDDYNDILENTSIRSLRHLWQVVHVSGKGFMTRPVANLTFALDYALAGPKPFLFHLTNLGIHLGTALTLMGVVRRTLALPGFNEQYKDHLSTLSLLTALLWALHPLTTEAVSYITQRYESLMAFFVLLAFYALLRGQVSSRPRYWNLLGALACLLALGSKEVAVSLPLLVIYFDKAFIAGSFLEAWRRRRELYLGMLLAWVCFAFIQINAVPRAFAGFELTTPWWRYALNQPAVVLHYLRLTVWPHPLIFDYYWPVTKTFQPLIPGLLSIGALLAFTGWAMVSRPKWAFLPIGFFSILAPTSSVMPILDLAVEHRMYLPLMGVVIALVLGAYNIWTWSSDQSLHLKRWIQWGLLGVFSMALSGLGILTYLRNEDYRDPMDLWRSVTEAVPGNPRAHNNYAFNLVNAGYLHESLREYAKTVELAPRIPLFQSNYGLTLAKAGKYEDALKHLRIAVTLEPNNSKYINNLGFVLILKGSVDNAAICFETALEVNPKDEQAYAGLASVMQIKHDNIKARDYIGRAKALNPYNPGYWFQESQILLDLGDVSGARSAFRTTINLEPNAQKIADLAWTMHGRGMDGESVMALRKALEMKPGGRQFEIRLAWILATSQDPSVRDGAEAVRLARQVLKSQATPSPELLDLLAVSLAEAGRFDDAIATTIQGLKYSKDGKEKWVHTLEAHLASFKQDKPVREGSNAPGA